MLAPAAAGAIVAFGDSITDGVAATLDSDRAWPSLLAAKLSSGGSSPPLAVINLGLSGNRLLRHGFGVSALHALRSRRARPGRRPMDDVLLGINDITFPAVPGMPPTEAVTADDVIWGLRQIVERAHEHGIKVAGATIMPVGGVSTYTEGGEAIRQAVNQWIRTSGVYDAVLDFDEVVRDPADPKRLRARVRSWRSRPPQRRGQRGDGRRDRRVGVPLREARSEEEWLVILVTTLAVGGCHCRPARRRRVGGPRCASAPPRSTSRRRKASCPKNSLGVLDHLYARAIVIESGTSSAALITVDAGGVPTPIWEAVTRQVETELKIPAANVLLTATHTHSAGGPRGPDYAQKIVESVRLAKQRLAPARVGYGTGVSYINVNRQIIDPKTHRWWEGPNYDGPSDKTVAVLKFETLDGRADRDLLQLRRPRGDRRAARSGERRHSRRGVALRRGLVRRPDRRGVVERRRRRSEPDLLPADLRPARDPHQGLRHSAASTSATRCRRAAKGWTAKNPAVARLMNQQRQMVSSMGQFLGEEVLHVMRGIERTDTAAAGPGRLHHGQLSWPRADQPGPGRLRRHL